MAMDSGLAASRRPGMILNMIRNSKTLTHSNACPELPRRVPYGEASRRAGCRKSACPCRINLVLRRSGLARQGFHQAVEEFLAVIEFLHADLLVEAVDAVPAGFAEQAGHPVSRDAGVAQP